MPSELQAAPTSRHEGLRALLQSGDAYATTMFTLAADTWGLVREDEDKPIWLDWHPQVLHDEIETTFGVKLPQLSLDRLMAAIAIVTTDQFFTDVKTFIPLANVLAGSEFSPDAFDPADAVECAWAVTEALLLDPPEEKEDKFSDDIRAYVTHVLKDEGYVTPPDVLRIALDGDFSAQVSYNFADDPELFKGIYANQQDKTKQVTDLMRENLLELLHQLRALPLTHGNTNELQQHIERLSRSE